jgi:predicted NAD/FAD-binding protein
MNIAVVGTGISGLVAAHLLGRHHAVTVLEAEARIGGHAHTVRAEVDGRVHDVDTGFIVFNEKTYPGFCRLLARLGVESQPSDMSFSVRSDRHGVEYATHSLNGWFARRRHMVDPRFHAMLREILRFHRESRAALAAGGEELEALRLGDLVRRRGYSSRFVDLFLVPMGAAIWSTPPSRFLDFPALAFLRFFENHGLLHHRDQPPWRTIRGGSRRYVDALVAATRAEFRTRSPVLAARRRRDRVELVVPDGGTLAFDHVVFACHSDQALRVLEDAGDAERAVLGAIRYQENEVVLHTDAGLMPRRRPAWASWNSCVDADPGAVRLTYWMNRLQAIESSRPLLVTLNGSRDIAPDRVLMRQTYDHPLFDREALRAQRDRALVDGVNRTSFCGAYWGNGFHEDGVQSALVVARRFGVGLDDA